MGIVRFSRLIRSLSAILALGLTLACGGGDGAKGPAGPGLSVTINRSVWHTDWAAVKDGEGAWTRVELRSNSFTIPIQDPAGRYSFVFSSDQRWGRLNRIWHGTLGEQPEVCTPFVGETVSIQCANLSGLATHEVVDPYFGQSFFGSYLGAAGFRLNVKPATSDLVLFTHDESSPDWSPLRASILRGIVVHSSGLDLPPIDMSGALPFASLPVPYTGRTPQYTWGGWHTVGGTSAYTTYRLVAGANPAMAPAIPPSLLAPGDLQSTGIASGSPGLWREAIIWHKGTIAQALTLPALLNFTLVQDPLTAAVTAQWTAIPGAKHHSLTLVQPDSDIPLEIQVEATAGWIGTGPTVTYVLPVVPGISGLQTFDRKASIEWRITASAASFGLAPPDLPQPFQEGDWAWFSGARGTRPAASAGIDAPSHAPAELNRPKWFGRFN